MVEKAILVMRVSASPISELRGGIPLGISLGLPPLWVLLIAVVVNALVLFPVLLVLTLFYQGLFSRIPLFRFYIEGLRARGGRLVGRHGNLELVTYAGLPLILLIGLSGLSSSPVMDRDLRK